ncbi:MAG: hypothetical protein ITG00_00680 [Flavobacterium sp.]|nr:hypothetical protein [Flavobacterium sp.]
MKKVFLSLALVAAMTVVSCKQSEEKVEETTIETEEVTAEPEVIAEPVDTMSVESTTTTTEVEATPAQ